MRKNYTRSICVFCGSELGTRASHNLLAIKLGEKIVHYNLRLVYGGGNLGLMGTIATEVQNNGGTVLGIIPQTLKTLEVAKDDIETLVVTDDMHARKKLMYVNSDLIMVLPGGIGTLDEFFEVLTWAQLDLHKKPIILLDNDDFWRPLLDLISHQIDEGFVSPKTLTLFSTFSNIETAFDHLLEKGIIV